VPTDGSYQNGFRDAELKGIRSMLGDIREKLNGLDKKLDGHMVADAGLRTSVKVLWGAAAAYGVSILGLALHALFGG